MAGRRGAGVIKAPLRHLSLQGEAERKTSADAGGFGRDGLFLSFFGCGGAAAGEERGAAVGGEAWRGGRSVGKGVRVGRDPVGCACESEGSGRSLLCAGGFLALGMSFAWRRRARLLPGGGQWCLRPSLHVLHSLGRSLRRQDYKNEN